MPPSKRSATGHPLQDYQLHLLDLERQDRKRKLLAAASTPFQFEEDARTGEEHPTSAPGYPRRPGDEDERISVLESSFNVTSPIPPGHDISLATLSPDQKYLAVSDGSEVLIYDVAAREVTERLMVHQTPLYPLSFAPRSPDQLQLARGAAYLLVTREGPKQTLLWYLTLEGKVAGQFKRVDTVGLASKALSSIEDELVDLGWSRSEIAGSSLGENFQTTILQAEKQRAATLAMPLPGVPGPGSPFSTDGKFLVYMRGTGRTDHPQNSIELIVRNIENNEDLCHIHIDYIHITAVHCSPDGRWLASLTLEGDLRIHSVENGNESCITKFPNGHVHHVAFSPDFNHVVISILSKPDPRSDRTLRLFRVSEGVINWATKQYLGTYSTCHVEWSPDSTHIATSHGGEVQIWSVMVNPREIIQQYTIKGLSGDMDSDAQTIRASWLDGGCKILLERLFDGELEIRDIENKTKWRIHGHARAFEGKNAWVLQDHTLMTYDHEGMIRFWKL